MAREQRKKRITKQREEQILNAALDVFSEKGFGAATIPEIAEKAGLAVGSIYNYFTNKHELFVAVIKHYILNAPLLELIDELPKGDIDATLRQILLNRLNLVNNSDISHIPFLMTEVQRDPELQELWYNELLKPFLSKLEGIYGNILQTGKDDNITPVITVRIVGGTILGFLMLRMMEGKKSPVNKIPVEKVIETLADFLLHGLSGKNDGEVYGERENE